MKKGKQNFKVTGIGELLWDLLPEGKKLGGATTNFAYHASQLGAESYNISAIGNDAPGDEILEYFEGLKLHTGFIHRVKEKETGVVNVQLNKGIPTYDIKTDVAWDFIPFTENEKLLAKECDAVCFGTLAQRSEKSRTSIKEFLKATKPECLRVFDINLRQSFFSREIITDSLELASVLKLNDEELPVVTEFFSLNGNEEVVLDKLIKLFKLDLAVLTKGGKGSLLKTAEETSFCEVPEVKIADTVGAGDSFTAAVAIGWLNGKPLAEINQAATEIAAFVCTSQGATPVLPDKLATMVQ